MFEDECRLDDEQESPVVSKSSTRWQGIRLERYRLRRGQFPEHAHEEHAAIVSLGGGCRGEVRTANGFRVGGRNRAGSLILVPARRPHTISLDGDAECVSLYLDPLIVARAASEAGTGAGEIVERRAAYDPVVANVAQALLAESERGEALYGRLYAESLANVLAIHLLRNYAATTSAAAPARFSGGLSGPALRRVLAYMADNYGHDLSLTDLAGEAGISTFHFAREFKRSTGEAPHQYLIKLRVERAKGLLAEGRLPIVEVGLRTGFNSQSHFARLFRRLTGTTPGSYRGASRARREYVRAPSSKNGQTPATT
ncbi:MAG TPA: AraC family transcriptional regulator [Pyrinomonadaceae bacterium]